MIAGPAGQLTEAEGEESIHSGSQRPRSRRTVRMTESRAGDSHENQADLSNGGGDHDLDSCIKLNSNDCAFSG